MAQTTQLAVYGIPGQVQSFVAKAAAVPTESLGPVIRAIDDRLDVRAGPVQVPSVRGGRSDTPDLKAGVQS